MCHARSTAVAIRLRACVVLPNLKPGTRQPILENRNPKPLTPNPKPQIQNPTPTTLYSHGGLRSFHQKSTFLFQGPYVVQFWLRDPRNYEAANLSESIMWVLSLIKPQELNMDQNELKEIPAAFAGLTNLKATPTPAQPEQCSRRPTR